MNILLPKLLSQTLRQSSQTRFPSCKRASSNIPSQTSRSTCENQRSPSSIRRIDSVFLECFDCISRKGECSFDVDL